MAQSRYVINFEKKGKSNSTGLVCHSTHTLDCKDKEELELYSQLVLEDNTITKALVVDKASHSKISTLK